MLSVVRLLTEREDEGYLLVEAVAPMAVEAPGLIERDAELAAVGGALERAEAGEGSLIIVEGAPGLGKTSLLKSVEAAAERRGWLVMSARGGEMEQTLTFGVVRQLMRPMLVTSSAAQQEGYFTGPAQQAWSVLNAPGVDEAGDFAVLHGLYWLTVNLAQTRPVLMVVDDLHWLDPPSLRFLLYLQPRLGGLPVVVMTASRMVSGATGDLVEQLIADPECSLLRPRPLTEDGTARLLREQFQMEADPEFSIACHKAAGGNPLLLHELSSFAVKRNVQPHAQNASVVEELGPQSVAQHVAARASRLSSSALALMRAVAVLGDGTQVTSAAELANLGSTEALKAAEELSTTDILQQEGAGSFGVPVLSFVHPLVRAVLSQQMPTVERAEGHRRAADLLIAAGADAERVASHLLRTPSTGAPRHAEVLREAAAAAVSHGAPETAYAYLTRCLDEPLNSRERLDVLIRAGRTAHHVDASAGVHFLEEAAKSVPDGEQYAHIAQVLGDLYHLTGLFDAATDVRLQALRGLPDDQSDASRRLYAGLLATSIVTGLEPDIRARISELVRIASPSSVTGCELASVIACIKCIQGDPEAVSLALRGLTNDLLVQQTQVPMGLVCAWYTLAFADHPHALASVESAISHVHRHGGVGGLVGTLVYRALCRLRRGELREAIADGQQCMRATDASGISIARLHIGPWLAEAYLEQGALEEARTVLRWAGRNTSTAVPPQQYLQLATARLLREEGHYEEAFRSTEAAGASFEAVGGDNAAVLPWRSEAALSLHALGRQEEAVQYAEHDVVSARRWQSPVGIGRALRAAGVVAAGSDRLALLEEAVDLLSDTPARLYQAQALIDFGTELFIADKVDDARDRLRSGVDLAEMCGAPALVERGIAQLRATGARPRRTKLTGRAALTPSEVRVAQLAAEGHTNRAIAQELYVTPKTVEVHLSSVYRKLGIRDRKHLQEALD